MIYGIITAAGIVVYTLGPWPAGSMDQCVAGADTLRTLNTEKIESHDLKIWCAEFDAPPILGARLSPIN